MGMFRIYEKPAKSKKKPGWKQKEVEYQAWLSKINSMSSGINAPKKVVKPEKKNIQVQAQPLRASYVVGGCTKPVARPEIQYRDNPEMLERELKARARRFTTAPAYNKGGDVLVTDDLMKDIMAGATRRRN